MPRIIHIHVRRPVVEVWGVESSLGHPLTREMLRKRREKERPMDSYRIPMFKCDAPAPAAAAPAPASLRVRRVTAPTNFPLRALINSVSRPRVLTDN